MILNPDSPWYPRTDVQILAYLAEECSEVQKCCMKMIRNGTLALWEGKLEFERLNEELVDLVQAVEFLQRLNVGNDKEIINVQFK